MAITRAQTFGVLTLAVPFAMFVGIFVAFKSMGWLGDGVGDQDSAALLADTSAHATALTYATFVLTSTFLGLVTLSLLSSRPTGGFFRAARVVLLGGIAFQLLMPTCLLVAVVLGHDVIRYSVYALWVPCGVALFVALLREGAPKKRPVESAVPKPHSPPLTPPT